VPYRVQLDGLQILWLSANPLRTHGIGESGSKTITGWLLMGAAVTNRICWLDTNPFTGLLLHPKSYRIMHLPFVDSKICLFLTAITSFPETISFAWLAGCGSCQSSLVVEYQPHLQFTAASKPIS